MQGHLVLKPVGEVYGTTIANTITSLPSIPNSALAALVQVETADIRVRFDATTSMTGGAGQGLYRSSGDIFEIVGWDNLNRCRMHREGGTSAFINVIYSGEGQP